MQLKIGKAIPIIILMVTITQGASIIYQAWQPDPQPDFNMFVIPFVAHCNIFEYPQRDGYILTSNTTALHDGSYHPTRDPLKWWFNCLSYKVFNTPKLVPIFFNIGLMPLVYLLSMQLTRDKLISLIAFGAFTANPLYSQWVTSGTYDQVWSFFLVLSIYLMYRFKNNVFGISYLTSLAAKALGLMYLPSLVFSYLNSQRDGKTKTMFLMVVIGSVTVLSILFFGIMPWYIGGSIGLHMENVHRALYDNVGMLLPEIPFLAIFGYLSMTYKPQIPTPNKLLCAIWIVNAFLTTPIIYLFTNQFQFVYRFVPLAVFMSIFIGITIVDISRCYVESRLKKQSIREK